MPVQSASIEGFSVVLYPGKCFVSKAYFFGTLEEVLATEHIHDARGDTHRVTSHQIELIKQWAKAHGYIKERRIAGTQTSSTANTGRWFERFDPERQRAIPLEIPTTKPRRCARPAGSC